MIEYKSRKFCKDINCLSQRCIDGNLNSKEIAKRHCREHCKAYQFHKWLKDNGYKIVKEAKNANSKE